MHALTLRSEHAEDLRRLLAGAAEPVRHAGVKLGSLTGSEDVPSETLTPIEAPTCPDELAIGLSDPDRDQLALVDWLVSRPQLLRTLVLTTVAVPIEIYDLMPQLHKVRT